MGLSPGFGDPYHWTLPDQRLLVNGLEDGVYRLWADADPGDWFRESDEGNNLTWVDLRLTAERDAASRRGRPAGACRGLALGPGLTLLGGRLDEARAGCSGRLRHDRAHVTEHREGEHGCGDDGEDHERHDAERRRADLPVPLGSHRRSPSRVCEASAGPAFARLSDRTALRVMQYLARVTPPGPTAPEGHRTRNARRRPRMRHCSPMRVLLADDHRLMLDGIRRALDDDGGFEVVGETQNGAQVLPLVGQTSPDLVVLDVRMPNMDGLQVLEEIKRRYPDVKVVMLSASTTPDLIEGALRRGASAYVLKTVDPTDLPSTLRQVAGGTVFSTVGATEAGAPSGAKAAGLTDREIAILTELAKGKSNDEIAKELWVTQQTVKFHLTNVYRKLGAKNRADAVRQAYQLGLIERPLGDE